MAKLTLQDLILHDWKKAAAMDSDLNNRIINATDDELADGMPLSNWQATAETYSVGSNLGNRWTELSLSELDPNYSVQPQFGNSSIYDTYITPPMQLQISDAPMAVDNLDYILWTKLESLTWNLIPEWVTDLGMFAIFYNVAKAVKNGTTTDNILKEVLSSVYDAWNNVGFLQYIADPNGLGVPTVTTLKIEETDVNVSYLDFALFITKYPHVYAFSSAREQAIEELKNTGTTTVFDAGSSDATVAAAIQEVNITPDPIIAAPPENQVGTHYVRRFLGDDPEDEDAPKTMALLRTDYVKSGDAAASIPAADTKTGDEYNADQTLFSGSPKKELPSHTQVVVLKKGIGKGALFYKVDVLKESGEVEDSGYIDSRVLNEFQGYTLEKYCSFINGPLPTVEVAEPDESYVVPSWWEKTKCEPFLNKKENEYWVTLEYDKKDFEEGGKIEQNPDVIAQEGLAALLDFYGLRNTPDVIDTFIQGAGDEIKAGEKSQSDAERPDAFVQVLVQVPQTYFDADWPKRTRMPTHDEWAKIIKKSYGEIPRDRGQMVDNQIIIIRVITNKVRERINKLKQNLQQFKQRITQYEGKVIGISKSEIDKKIQRLDKFVAQITEFLKLNDKEFKESQEDILEIGLTRDFKVAVYAMFSEQPAAGSVRKTEPLRKGIRCLRETNDVIADRRTAVYYFQAEQIDKTREPTDENDDLGGIHWVVGFTLYESLTLVPGGKAEEEEEEEAINPDPSEEEEVPKEEPTLKTAEDESEAKAKRDEPKEVKKTEDKAKNKTDSGGDSLFEGDNFANLLKNVVTSEDMYKNILFRINLGEFLARAVACLKNQLPALDAAAAALTGFLKMLPKKELVMILTNAYLLQKIKDEKGEDAEAEIRKEIAASILAEQEKKAAEDASKLSDTAPAADLSVQSNDSGYEIVNGQNDGSDLVEISAWGTPPPSGSAEAEKLETEEEPFGGYEIINGESEGPETPPGLASKTSKFGGKNWAAIGIAALSIFKKLGATDILMNVFQSMLDEMKDNLAKGLDTSSWPPGLKELGDLLNPYLDRLKIILDVAAASGLLTAENIEQVIRTQDAPAVGMPGAEYTDDPLAGLDEAIEQMLIQIITEILVTAIKTLLEEILKHCEGLDIERVLADQQLRAAAAAAAEREAMEDEWQNAYTSMSDMTEDDITTMTDEDLYGRRGAVGDPNASNLAGTIDMSSLYVDSSRFDRNLGNIAKELNPNMPISYDVIEELKLLLDYLSQVLKPTEICSLLSYAASESTLKIVLKIINTNNSFEVLRLFITTTDDVAKYFALLGQYVDNSICENAIKDLSLIAMLCEKAISEDFYCNVLKQKGFSEEQCEQMMSEKKDALKDQLEKLEQILSFPTLSDYFQSQIPQDICEPGSPLAALINDPQINMIMDSAIKTIIRVISQQFDMEMMGVKSIFIKETIVPYGGEYPRYPELGRDFMQGSPGSAGLRGNNGIEEDALFFDDAGAPLPDNWPRQDIIEKSVAPELNLNLKEDNTSNILTQGIVSIDTQSSDNFVYTLYSTTNKPSDLMYQPYDYTGELETYVEQSLEPTTSLKNQILALVGEGPWVQYGGMSHDPPPNTDIEQAMGGSWYPGGQWHSKHIIWEDLKREKAEEQDILDEMIIDCEAVGDSCDVDALGKQATKVTGLTGKIAVAKAARDHIRYGDNQAEDLWFIYMEIIGENYAKAQANEAGMQGMTEWNTGLAETAAAAAESSFYFINPDNTDITSRMVEVYFPKYSYIVAQQAQNDKNSFTLDYNRFKVWYQGSKNKEGLRKIHELSFDVNDTVGNKEAYDLLASTTAGALDNINGNGGITLTDELTIPQYTFAKWLSFSLNKFTAGNGVRAELENNISDMHQYLVANELGKIFKNIGKSRLFNINNFSKLLFSPKSQWAIDRLVCNNLEGGDLGDLRKSLLDPDGIKDMVDEYYKKIACEAYGAPDNGADPVNDAIKYAMVLIFARLNVAEFIVRAAIFFSRYSVEQTILDSDLFLTLVASRMKESSDMFSTDFMTDVYDTSYNILKRRVFEKKKIKFLSNEIFWDITKNEEERRFTNIKENIFNLADMKVLSNKPIKPSLLVKITEGLGFDTSQPVALSQVYSRLKKKLQDISLKYLINENIKSLAPKVNKMLLDKDVKNISENTILASSTIYDIPTKLISFEEIEDKFPGTAVGISSTPPGCQPGSTCFWQLSDSGGSNTTYLFKSFEEERIAEDGYDIKNINVDNNFFRDEGSDLADAGKSSSFYNHDGYFTDLGEKTKNGGFILQRYVKVKINNSDDAINKLGALNNNLHSSMKSNFLTSINADDLLSTNKAGNLYISYKAFDYGLKSLLETLMGYALSATFDLEQVLLSDMFSTISYGIRMVYVLPHGNVANFVTDTDNFPLKFSSKVFDAVSQDLSIPGSVHNLIKSSIEGATAAAGPEEQALKENIFVNRAYEIRELSATDPETKSIFAQAADEAYIEMITSDYDDFYEEQAAQEVMSELQTAEASTKHLKSIYVIPIEGAWKERNLSGLGTYAFVDSNIVDHILGPSLPDIDSLIQRKGMASQTRLGKEVLDLPSSALMNKFAMPYKDLLNTALLHTIYFPYRSNYNFDNLLKKSKESTVQQHKAASVPRDEHPELIVDPGEAGVEDFNDILDKSMSMGLTDFAFYDFIKTIIPKWILRYTVGQVDPCMAKAMEIQEERKLDDSKLPDIVAEIRPVPIFPTYFPWMGDPKYPITVAGIIYTALQFLTGVEDMHHVAPPEESTVDYDPELDIDLGASLPEDACD